jgi:hypothetical protein
LLEKIPARSATDDHDQTGPNMPIDGEEPGTSTLRYRRGSLENQSPCDQPSTVSTIVILRGKIRVGSKKAMAIAVKNDRALKPYTYLSELTTMVFSALPMNSCSPKGLSTQHPLH